MPRRVLNGVVVSAKANKTIIVKVERTFKHPIYQKPVTVSKKYAAHDENNMYKEGQSVQIIECRPMSKRKSWMVQENS